MISTSSHWKQSSDDEMSPGMGRGLGAADMKLLNIGCGTKTSSDPRVINLDWSMYLVIRSHPILRALSRLLLSEVRLERLNHLPSSILVHDLRKGIPFEGNSVDAVYHSHFLEHL